MAFAGGLDEGCREGGIEDPCKAFGSSAWKNISWGDKDHTESRLGRIGDVRCFLAISMSRRCHVGPGSQASEDRVRTETLRGTQWLQDVLA